MADTLPKLYNLVLEDREIQQLAISNRIAHNIYDGASEKNIEGKWEDIIMLLRLVRPNVMNTLADKINKLQKHLGEEQGMSYCTQCNALHAEGDHF